MVKKSFKRKSLLCKRKSLTSKRKSLLFKGGAAAVASTNHGLFEEWKDMVNETINYNLSSESRAFPYKLELEFMKLTSIDSTDIKHSYRDKFKIEVTVDELYFNNNIDIKVTKVKNMKKFETYEKDSISEKYYENPEFSGILDQDELFSQGYLIWYFDKNKEPLHKKLGELIAFGINFANSNFYTGTPWNKAKNKLKVKYKQQGSFYFENIKNESTNKILRKIPERYPPRDFRTTDELKSLNLRIGSEEGTAKTHILAKYNCLVLTIFQTIKYLAENEVFFNRGKFIITLFRIDKYYDNSNKILKKYRWEQYLDQLGYAARADIVFYNRYYNPSKESDPKLNIKYYNNYMLQHDIDSLIDYFITNIYRGDILDNFIGERSNNLAYNKRLSKSIFYSLISSDTSTLDIIRDKYSKDHKSKEEAEKMIHEKELDTTRELEYEKRYLCVPEDKEKNKVKNKCLSLKYNLQLDDLCEPITERNLPKYFLYGTYNNYFNYFYYMGREKVALCSQQKTKKKKKTRR